MRLNTYIDKYSSLSSGKCFWDNKKIDPYTHKCGVVYIDLYINFKRERIVLCKDDYTNRFKNIEAELEVPAAVDAFRKYYIRHDTRDVLTVSIIEDYFASKPLTCIPSLPVLYARASFEESSFFCGACSYLQYDRQNDNPFVCGALFYKVSNYHSLFAVYNIRDIIMHLDGVGAFRYEFSRIIEDFLLHSVLPYIERRCNKSRRAKFSPVCRDIIHSFYTDDLEVIQQKIINLMSLMLDSAAKTDKKKK